MQWQIRLIFWPLQSCYHRLHISFPNFSLNVNWCRLLSQLLSCEWPSSSQHAVQWGPQHHASSHWKSSQVEGPIHSKLTLTGSDWIPLPLAASLTAAQTAGVSQSPSPLLQLSFTSTDMSDQCAFCSGRRNLCLSISFASLSVLFISFHSLPPSFPLHLTTFSSTTGRRYLLRFTDSCLIPLFLPPKPISASCFDVSLPLPPLTNEDICDSQSSTFLVFRRTGRKKQIQILCLFDVYLSIRWAFR